MISSHDYCDETEVLLDKIVKQHQSNLKVPLNGEILDAFFALEPDKQRKGMETLARDVSAFVSAAELMFEVVLRPGIQAHEFTVLEIAESVLKRYYYADRAVEHLKQVLLSVYDAVVGPVARHDDDSFCIDSLAPLSPSDIAQIIIEAANGRFVVPPGEEPPAPPIDDYTVDI